MVSVKVHYDGWIPLPEEMRRKLGVDTGARLTAELIEDTIHLRLTAPSAGRDREEDDPAEVVADIPATSVAPEKPLVRRGRPPKVRDPETARLSLLPKARGRRTRVEDPSMA